MKNLSTINGWSEKLKKAHGFHYRAVWGMIALVVITAVGVGTTYAWNMHEVQQANILQSHNVSIQIDESSPDKTVTAGGTKEKKVTFLNTSSAPVFLRVSYVETWKNGSQWLEDGGNYAIKNWTSAWSSDWWDGSDGWYYYKKVLPAGISTAEIISSVTFPADLVSEYADGQYDLIFMAEAVQMSDEAAVNRDAAATLFEKTATVSITSVSNGAVTAGTVNWS